MFLDTSCWLAPDSMSLDASFMVCGVVVALEKRLVAATIPVRKAVASSFSTLASLIL